MPNLVLTYSCNENCDFCFVADGSATNDYSIRRVRELLPFIRTFERERINLVGGEPTLHPDFFDILSLLLRQGYIVNVFTNGNLPSSYIDKLSNLHAGEYSFCINRTSPKLKSNTASLYRKLGYRITLSVTVHQLKQPLDHILNEIVAYNLNNYYRLGIALPIWPDYQNKYLSPNDYKATAEYLFDFIKKGISCGIRPIFDCGFPYCFFNNSHKEFFKDHAITFSSNCGVIPDVLMDYSIIPCFPLAKIVHSTSKSSCWKQINKKLTQNIQQYKKFYIFDECENCLRLAHGECCGGCMALRIEKTGI